MARSNGRFFAVVGVCVTAFAAWGADSVRVTADSHRTVGKAVAEPLRISVACDRADAIYQVGDTATFSVTAKGTNGVAATSGTVTVVLDNFGTKRICERTHDLAKGNPFAVSGSLGEPGFLRVTVKAETVANPALDSRDYVWSAAFSPERIRQSAARPADFDAFWAAEKARLAREVPLDPRVEKDEARSAGDRRLDWYRASFATFGRRVYGTLSIPTKPGKSRLNVKIASAGWGDFSNFGGSSASEAVLWFSVFPFRPDWEWRKLNLKAKYDATGDKRIPAALERYYLRYDETTYAEERNLLSLEGMLWTYGKTKNAKLLEVAENTGARYLNTISALMGSDGWLPQSLHNGDGLHLNTDAFNIVLNYIRTHGWE